MNIRAKKKKRLHLLPSTYTFDLSLLHYFDLFFFYGRFLKIQVVKGACYLKEEEIPYNVSKSFASTRN